MGFHNLVTNGIVIIWIMGAHAQYQSSCAGSTCQTRSYQPPVYPIPCGGSYPCQQQIPSSCGSTPCQGYGSYSGYGSYQGYSGYPGYSGYSGGVQVIRPGYQGGFPGYQGGYTGYQGGYTGYQGGYAGYQGVNPGYGYTGYPGGIQVIRPGYSGSYSGYPGGYIPLINYPNQPLANVSVSNQTNTNASRPNLPYFFYPGAQNYYPFLQNGPASNISSPNSTLNTSVKDPFANVTTDFIDVDPQSFNNYMNFYHLRPQIQPIRTRRTKISHPTYKVLINSNQSNFTEKPPVFNKHDVQHKSYSFRKTYVITPENRTSAIKLSFLNGEPVKEETPGVAKEAVGEETATEGVAAKENEKPTGGRFQGRKLTVIPEFCPEGTRYIKGLGCHKTF